MFLWGNIEENTQYVQFLTKNNAYSKCIFSVHNFNFRGLDAWLVSADCIEKNIYDTRYWIFTTIYNIKQEKHK